MKKLLCTALLLVVCLPALASDFNSEGHDCGQYAADAANAMRFRQYSGLPLSEGRRRILSVEDAPQGREDFMLEMLSIAFRTPVYVDDQGKENIISEIRNVIYNTCIVK